MSAGLQVIYKIVGREEWARAIAAGVYHGSADDHRDGYIHLSSGPQLPGTLSKHFAGRGDLAIAAFAVTDLADQLRWEPSRGGQLFPHCYGSLDPRRALWVADVEQNRDGSHVMPKGITL